MNGCRHLKLAPFYRLFYLFSYGRAFICIFSNTILRLVDLNNKYPVPFTHTIVSSLPEASGSKFFYKISHYPMKKYDFLLPDSNARLLQA